MDVVTTPPVSPWNAVTITTAVIAVLGFLVAAGGLVLGVNNLRHQSRRDFPRAHWKTSWTKNDDRTMTFCFVNEGAGDAKDVELWVLTGKAGGKRTWECINEYGTLSFGQQRSINFGSKAGPNVKLRLFYRHGVKIEKMRKLRSTGRRR